MKDEKKEMKEEKINGGIEAETPRSTICALDDDESILYTLEAMARTQSWHFRGTTDVEVCMDWVRGGIVEMLLLDYHMPAQNGLDVLKRVKVLDPALPVLILTIEQNPGTAEALLSAGAEDFINKPVRLADFLSRIRLHRRLQASRGAQTEFPKGISRARLARITAFLHERGEALEIDAVAAACDMSYTTAHRYLDHLVKSGAAAVSEAPQYGKPGRPTRAYRVISNTFSKT